MEANSRHQREKRSLISIYITFVNKVENYHYSFAPILQTNNFPLPQAPPTTMRLMFLSSMESLFFVRDFQINYEHFVADFREEEKGKLQKSFRSDFNKFSFFALRFIDDHFFAFFSLLCSERGIEKKKKLNVVNHFVEKYRRIIESQKYF